MSIREMLVSMNEAFNETLDNKVLGVFFSLLLIYCSISTIRTVWQVLSFKDDEKKGGE